MIQYRIGHYVTVGKQEDLYMRWLARLRDRKAQVAVIRRVNRMEHGNFDDHRFCRDGVWELRVDVGPGLRVYYAQAGKRIVLLLCGGSKRTQQADIERALAYWQDWQEREDHEKQTP